MKNKYISVGKILNFHGVHGEAKLGYSKDKESFLLKLDSAFIKYENDYIPLEISSLKFTPKIGIIKFKGIDTLNDILKYKGCLVFVKEDMARDFLEEDEFLIDELVGMEVYDDNNMVGVVVGVSNNGATDLLSVKTASKNVSLVPFVKAIVTEVDIKSRKIKINNLEGLLS